MEVNAAVGGLRVTLYPPNESALQTIKTSDAKPQNAKKKTQIQHSLESGNDAECRPDRMSLRRAGAHCWQLQARCLAVRKDP